MYCPARWLVRPRTNVKSPLNDNDVGAAVDAMLKPTKVSRDPLTGTACVASVCEQCKTPKASLTRKIRFALARVEQLTIARPFLINVDPKEFPDYNSIVSKPICIGDIDTKAVSGKYDDVQTFLQDIELLQSNCKQYCEGKFPLVAHAANIIAGICRSLVKPGLTIHTAANTFHRRRMQFGGRQYLLQRLELELHEMDPSSIAALEHP